MKVTVDKVHQPVVGSTIIQAEGTDKKGRRVVFAGDHRVMTDLMDLVLEQGSVKCQVERWQILSITMPKEG